MVATYRFYSLHNFDALNCSELCSVYTFSSNFSHLYFCGSYCSNILNRNSALLPYFFRLMEGVNFSQFATKHILNMSLRGDYINPVEGGLLSVSVTHSCPSYWKNQIYHKIGSKKIFCYLFPQRTDAMTAISL